MEVKETAGAVDNELEIQPEGGLTLDDIIDEPEYSDNALDDLFRDDDGVSDGDDSGTDGSDTDDHEEASAPTPEQTDPDAVADAIAKSAPTTEQIVAAQKLKFTATIDRKSQEVEVDMSELPELYQRAMNQERMQNRYNEQQELVRGFNALSAQLGYDSAKAMIEATQKADRDRKVQELMEGGAPKEIAEDYVDRSIASLSAKVDTNASEEDIKDKPASDGASEQDKDLEFYRSEVNALFEARPELRTTLKELPQEVATALVQRKGSLRALYSEWENRQLRAETDKAVKRQSAAAAQAEAASRAPVRGSVSSAGTERVDPMLSAFMNDTW